MNYAKFLKETFHVDLPGRKSRARNLFTESGILPAITDILEEKDAAALHKKVVAELAARDDELRRADYEEYLSQTEAGISSPTRDDGRRVNQVRNSEAPARSGDVDPFMKKVREVKNERGCELHQAMSEVIKMHPGLHEDFLTKANRK